MSREARRGQAAPSRPSMLSSQARHRVREERWGKPARARAVRERSSVEMVGQSKSLRASSEAWCGPSW
jgi:hypothetical protein